jgi:DNA-binding NtrC family response regulator
MTKKFTHDLEKEAVLSALQQTDGNLRNTAKLLEIPYSTLNYKIRVLDLLMAARKLRAQAILKEIE